MPAEQVGFNLQSGRVSQTGGNRPNWNRADLTRATSMCCNNLFAFYADNRSPLQKKSGRNTPQYARMAHGGERNSLHGSSRAGSYCSDPALQSLLHLLQRM